MKIVSRFIAGLPRQYCAGAISAGAQLPGLLLIDLLSLVPTKGHPRYQTKNDFVPSADFIVVILIFNQLTGGRLSVSVANNKAIPIPVTNNPKISPKSRICLGASGSILTE